jgi:hypothetical protein
VDLGYYRGVTGAHNSVRQSSSTATYEEALAALKDSWEQCLAWARSSGRELEVANSLDGQADIQDEDPLAALVREAELAAETDALSGEQQINEPRPGEI